MDLPPLVRGGRGRLFQTPPCHPHGARVLEAGCDSPSLALLGLGEEPDLDQDLALVGLCHASPRVAEGKPPRDHVVVGNVGRVDLGLPQRIVLESLGVLVAQLDPHHSPGRRRRRRRQRNNLPPHRVEALHNCVGPPVLLPVVDHRIRIRIPRRISRSKPLSLDHMHHKRRSTPPVPLLALLHTLALALALALALSLCHCQVTNRQPSKKRVDCRPNPNRPNSAE